MITGVQALLALAGEACTPNAEVVPNLTALGDNSGAEILYNLKNNNRVGLGASRNPIHTQNVGLRYR